MIVSRLVSRTPILAYKKQEQYAFQLVGRERINGREAVHMTFRPKDKNDFA